MAEQLVLKQKISISLIKFSVGRCVFSAYSVQCSQIKKGHCIVGVRLKWKYKASSRRSGLAIRTKHFCCMWFGGIHRRPAQSFGCSVVQCVPPYDFQMALCVVRVKKLGPLVVASVHTPIEKSEFQICWTNGLSYGSRHRSCIVETRFCGEKDIITCYPGPFIAVLETGFNQGCLKNNGTSNLPWLSVAKTRLRIWFGYSRSADKKQLRPFNGGKRDRLKKTGL